MIVYADNVPGKGLFHVFPVLGHEYGGIGKSDLFADPVVKYLHSAAELSGADPDKRDPVPMCRVHVGLDFKSKT